MTDHKPKEHPILFSGPMVRAILDGTKTQTRRIIKLPLHCPNTGCELTPGELSAREINSPDSLCPFGTPGDRLWVRETFALWCHSFESVGIEYAAGREDKIVDFPDRVGMPPLNFQCQRNINGGRRKHPSIHMPRWASRITLEITAVRVERVQDISEEDAKAEGVAPCHPIDKRGLLLFHQQAFRNLWNSVAKPAHQWDSNPWVWVIEFKRL